MVKIQAITLFLLIVLLIGGNAFAESSTDTKWQEIKVSIPAPSISNNILGESDKQPIAIYLPPSYNTSTRRYPTVYFLPGFDDSVNDFVTNYFKLTKTMNKLINSGIIKEMIVVIANGKNKLGGSFYTNSSVTGNWEDFVVKDVVSYVDSNYRTIRSAEARGIAGHSMGGYGAFNIGMKYPEIFKILYAMSPGLYDKTGLEKSQMFQPKTAITKYFNLEKTLAALNPEDAKKRFISLALSNANDAGFAFSYGAAFSPNPDRHPPYLNYPYALDSNGGLVKNDDHWAAFTSGFGGVDEELERYKENLLSLKGFAFEVGTRDEYRWLYNGCKYTDSLLTEKGIPHVYTEFVGGHGDQTGKRMENNMLPFMSANLVFE